MFAYLKNTQKLVPALVATISCFGPIFISPMEEISTFKQKSEESFKEAWSRITTLQRENEPKMSQHGYQ